MSFGKFAATTIATAGTIQQIHQVVANCIYAEVNINILNSQTTDATIRVAITSAATPAVTDFIEDGVILPALGGTLENVGLILDAGEKIFVQSNKAGVVVRVSGKSYATVR